MFIKAKKTEERRIRQAPAPSIDSSRTVFSYHAKRSARGAEAAGAPRSMRSALWLGASKPVSPRPPVGGRFKRFKIALACIIAAILLVYGVSLGRTPMVVPLADTASRQVFLHGTDVYAKAAQAILGKSLSSTNKLTIDTAHIASEMQRQFPELERVSVALPFFGRTPTFYIQPAKPALLLRVTEGGVFVLDTSGRALMYASEAHGISRLSLPVVEDQSNLPVNLGQTALPSSNVTFITEVAGQLQAAHTTITAMTLPQGTSELDVRISGVPYLVKYNLHGDARAEAGAYLAVKAYLERVHKTPDAYVDVRVDNKAYYQ